MSEEKYELNLDVEEQERSADLQAMSELKETMTEQEQEILDDLQALSDKCAEAKIPCFLSAKFASQDDPSAAWYFGDTPPIAHSNFIDNFAALLLHLTCKMTLTNVKATNPATGETVYEVQPDKTGEGDNS